MNLFLSVANASVSGISPVADGTQVELVRINDAGTELTTLATTTTSAGKYSFNLTELELSFSSDLIVQVVNSNNRVRMRAFVASDRVNIDPVSEAAVQMVLEKLASAQGITLGNFTPQELADVTASIDLFATLKEINAGGVLDTVTAIKNAVTADANLMAFITSTSGTGQTTEGPGDIGNFFPSTQGNTWRYQGTISENGGTPVNYSNTVMTTGTKVINRVTTTVFTETNPENFRQAEEDYLFKDSRGITNWGNNDTTDSITPQLVPFQEVKFPIKVGSSFEQVNKKGLDLGEDLEGDGVKERADLTSEIVIAAFEEVSTPVGSFPNSVKIETRLAITITLSSDKTKVTETGTETEWFASGVGLVKRTRLLEIQVAEQSFSETLTEILTGAIVNGQGYGIRIEVTPATGLIQPGDTIQFTATAFDELNSPISGVTFTWNSSNPEAATIDSNGVATGLSTGVTSITALTVDLISNPVALTVLPSATFGPATSITTPGWPNSVAVGDFNGDGKLDLAVTNGFSNNVSILLGNGDGTFGVPTNFTASNAPGFVAVGDFNGDGKQDLAVLNGFDGYDATVSILLGNGDGTFGAATNFAVVITSNFLAVGDFNGDGKQDLAVVCDQRNDVSILLGNGDGTFRTAPTLTLGSNSLSVAVGDFNGDGKQDLAVSNTYNPNASFPYNVSILLGNGDGTFGAATNFAVGSNPYSVVVGDLNGDKRLDLAVANHAMDNVSILLGNGDGTFGPATNFAVGTFPRSVVIGDFNGDGIPDLAVANFVDGTVSILLGIGDGTFGPATNFAAGPDPWSLAIGDFNGDGKPDLALAGSLSFRVTILLNTTP